MTRAVDKQLGIEINTNHGRPLTTGTAQGQWVECGHKAQACCHQCFKDQAAELAALKAQRDRLLAKLNRLEQELQRSQERVAKLEVDRTLEQS